MSQDCCCLLERHGSIPRPWPRRLPRRAGAQLFTAEEFSADQVAQVRCDRLRLPRHGRGGAGGRANSSRCSTPASRHLQGKKIALFGSYGWGDGEWMRSWEDDCISAGATLACDSVICQDDPDDSALAECEALGKALQ